MTHHFLIAALRELADAVVDDWRWDDDDLDISYLGLILFGFAKEICRTQGFDRAVVSRAVQHCLTGCIQIDAVWNPVLLAKTAATTTDISSELMDAGRVMHGMNDVQQRVNLVFTCSANFRRKFGFPERTVMVCLTPLVMLLAAREAQKQAPLTKSEVLEVRDKATFWRMTISQAQAFYASQDAKMPLLRLNPRRVWEQWQKLAIESSSGIVP